MTTHFGVIVLGGGAPGEHAAAVIAEGGHGRLAGPFLSFSEIHAATVKALRRRIAAARETVAAAPVQAATSST